MTDHSDFQPGPQEHVESIDRAVADEAALNSSVSGGSEQSSRHSSHQASQQASQQAPPKVLTRPVSSGKDPAAGFSFTKAKPILQLDFGRPKQAPVIPQPSDLSRPSRVVPPETYFHRSPPLQDIPEAIQDVVNVAAHRAPSPNHHSPPTLKIALPIPSLGTIPAGSRAQENPTSTTISGPMTVDFSSTSTLPNKVSTATDDTLIGSDSIGTKHPPLKIGTSDRSKPASTTALSNHGPTEVIGVVDGGQVNKQHHSRKASEDPLTSVAGAPKITKSRPRKTRMGPATDGLPRPSTPKSTYTEDDLLRLLMYRRRQGQQELEYFKTTQNQKEAEILRLREIINNISNELQEVSRRETHTSAELSRIKANNATWKSKIKRLSDYVNGLTNDHQRLREDADKLQQHCADLFVAGKELHDTFEGAQRSVEQERIRSQSFKDDARHSIERLGQIIQDQRTQLQANEVLLTGEKERSCRLEDQISGINASHEQLLQVFTGHRDTITGKIDNLLHQAKSIVLPNKAPEPHSQNLMMPMLEQCISMLHKLHEADTVKPEDLGKLNDAMDSFVRGYVDCRFDRLVALSDLYSL